MRRAPDGDANIRVLILYQCVVNNSEMHRAFDNVLRRMDRILGSEESDARKSMSYKKKQWRLRLRIVRELQSWVFENLKEIPPNFKDTGSAKVTKPSTSEYKLRKSKQYVIEHLALGKMIYPREIIDPLFTSAKYDDESLRQQLLDGKYAVFQNILQNKLNTMSVADLSAETEVTWIETREELKPENLRRIQELQDGISSLTKYNLGEAGEEITDKIICLVLRYQCLDAFENNFHGSIPNNWSEKLNEFTECFASPFNHKLENYFSMFDEDIDFGSRGNFFKFIAEKDDILPPGKYEMNPPWMNAMYEKLQTIIEKSIKVNDVHVILIAPKWTDTKWIPGINSVLENSPERYWLYSQQIETQINYIHDMKDESFTQDTLIWVFSNTEVPEYIVQLWNPSKKG